MSLLGRLRKRQRHEEDGWALTFADMMTLLLAFFVLIVSISVVDVERYEEVADSMTEAMGSEEAKEQVRSDRVEERSMAELRSQVAGQRHRTLEEIHDILRTKLGRERAVALERREGAVAVDLQGKVLFELGSAELTTRAAYILRDIARTLSGLPYHVTVEGHTDNIPIRTDRFPSNWELSAARAAAVARYLLDWGLDPGRMKVVGLADTRPLAPNVDERGRPLPENQVRNRRVVILVHP